MRNSRKSKKNSLLNGEWGAQKRWGKKQTSSLRRLESKRIIRELLM